MKKVLRCFLSLFVFASMLLSLSTLTVSGAYESYINQTSEQSQSSSSNMDSGNTAAVLITIVIFTLTFAFTGILTYKHCERKRNTYSVQNQSKDHEK